MRISRSNTHSHILLYQSVFTHAFRLLASLLVTFDCKKSNQMEYFMLFLVFSRANADEKFFLTKKNAELNLTVKQSQNLFKSVNLSHTDQQIVFPDRFKNSIIYTGITYCLLFQFQQF
jgi:hypothetical protein